MLKQKHSNWVKMDVLKYDVRGRDGKVILKAGTRNVSILFRGGCYQFRNDAGDLQWVNKYRDAQGRIYNGH